MSTKLVRQQLNSVLRRSIDKQQEQQQRGEGKRKKQGRRKRKQQQPEESVAEKQQQLLAQNLKYFAKTTSASGKAQDLVAQVCSAAMHMPPPPRRPCWRCACTVPAPLASPPAVNHAPPALPRPDCSPCSTPAAAADKAWLPAAAPQAAAGRAAAAAAAAGSGGGG